MGSAGRARKGAPTGSTIEEYRAESTAARVPLQVICPESRADVTDSSLGLLGPTLHWK